jgi:hypothetical protein
MRSKVRGFYGVLEVDSPCTPFTSPKVQFIFCSTSLPDSTLRVKKEMYYMSLHVKHEVDSVIFCSKIPGVSHELRAD